MPEALHDWTHLRLQDFKSVGEYNHEVHKISSKLRFCGKEPTDAEKIEKKLCLLYFHLTGSSSTSTVHATTKSIPTLFIYYFRMKSMMSCSLRMALNARLVLNLYLKFIWMSRTGKSLMLPSTASLQTSMVSESATGTGSLETQTVGKAPQSPSLTKLNFATSVDATHTPLISARPQSIWPFCTSNPRDTKHLKGKGLKPTSTFLQMTPMELLVREMFLLDLASP